MVKKADVQVNREARIDCALAELYTKSMAAEKVLNEQKHADVLTKLYIRMNEVRYIWSPASFVCQTVRLACCYMLRLTYYGTMFVS